MNPDDKLKIMELINNNTICGKDSKPIKEVMIVGDRMESGYNLSQMMKRRLASTKKRL
jgi:hypothetical protein